MAPQNALFPRENVGEEKLYYSKTTSKARMNSMLFVEVLVEVWFWNVEVNYNGVRKCNKRWFMILTGFK